MFNLLQRAATVTIVMCQLRGRLAYKAKHAVLVCSGGRLAFMGQLRGGRLAFDTSSVRLAVH